MILSLQRSAAAAAIEVTCYTQCDNNFWNLAQAVKRYLSVLLGLVIFKLNFNFSSTNRCNMQSHTAENLPPEALSSFSTAFTNVILLYLHLSSDSSWTSVLATRYKGSQLGMNSLRWELVNVFLVIVKIKQNYLVNLVNNPGVWVTSPTTRCWGTREVQRRNNEWGSQEGGSSVVYGLRHLRVHQECPAS